MKYYTFYRESNNFDDILKDVTIKKFISERITWNNYLMIGLDDFREGAEKIFFYITLKYSEDMKTDLTKDYSPVPNLDYTPIKNSK